MRVALVERLVPIFAVAVWAVQPGAHGHERSGQVHTGAALSRTLVLSLGVVTGAVTALSTILSAISSDRFGRPTRAPQPFGDSRQAYTPG